MLQGNESFTKILISTTDVKTKLRIKTKKYALDSVIKFHTRSILRPMIFLATKFFFVLLIRKNNSDFLNLVVANNNK